MDGNKGIYLGTYKFNFPLNSADLVEFTEGIALLLKFEALEWSATHYPGGGISFTRYLAESHIEIDTYPESNVVEVMVVSCKPIEHWIHIHEYLDMNGFALVSENYLSKEHRAWQLC